MKYLFAFLIVGVLISVSGLNLNAQDFYFEDCKYEKNDIDDFSGERRALTLPIHVGGMWLRFEVFGAYWDGSKYLVVRKYGTSIMTSSKGAPLQILYKNGNKVKLNALRGEVSRSAGGNNRLIEIWYPLNEAIYENYGNELDKIRITTTGGYEDIEVKRNEDAIDKALICLDFRDE